MTPFKRFFAAIIFAAIVFAPALISQERSLSLEQCLQIGLQNSKQVHASLMKVKLAEAQASEAGALRFASLKYSASYSRLSKVQPFSVNTPFGTFVLSQSILDSYTMGLSLQQPLFTGFKLQSSYDAAKLNASAVNMDYTQAELDLFLNIKNAYWNLYKVIQIQNVIEEEIQTVNAHLSDVQNFYKHGLATKNDVLKIQVQLSQVELQRLDAANNVKLAILNLDNVINIPLSTNIKLQDSVSITDLYGQSRSIDDLVKEAINNRPEIKAMDLRVDASQKGVTAAQGDWFPQLFVAGEYDYSKPNQRLQPIQKKFYGTWNISVGVSYNLWNWGATIDRTDQAEASLEQAKDNFQLLKDAVTLDVNQSYFNLVKSREAVSVSRQNVNQAEENYRITDERFKQGLTLNSELLDAEVALTQAKTNYVQALVDYELSLAKMDRAVGNK